MPLHSWNGHTFEVRCEALPRAFVRLWVRADSGRFELVEVHPLAATRTEFAYQHPGSTWFPLTQLPFQLVDDGERVSCRVEFDVSICPPPGLENPFRYRIIVGDTEVATGETSAKASLGSWAFAIGFGLPILLIWFAMLSRG